jgi:hypothetical protein
MVSDVSNKISLGLIFFRSKQNSSWVSSSFWSEKSQIIDVETSCHIGMLMGCNRSKCGAVTYSTTRLPDWEIPKVEKLLAPIDRKSGIAG